MLTIKNLMATSEFLQLQQLSYNWKWLGYAMCILVYVVIRIIVLMVPSENEDRVLEMVKAKREFKFIGLVVITMVIIYSKNPEFIERFEPYYITEYQVLPIVGKKDEHTPVKAENWRKRYAVELKNGTEIVQLDVNSDDFHKYKVGDEVILIRTNQHKAKEDEQILTTLRSVEQQIKSPEN